MGEAAVAVVEGCRNVVRNPVVVGVTAAVMALLVPVVALAGVFGILLAIFVVGPIVVRFVGAVVVKPLLFGGVAGLAAAGFEERADLGDYKDSLRGNFLSLAGGYVLYEVAVLAVSIATGVAVLAVLWLGSELGPTAGEHVELVAFGVGGVGAVVLVAFAVTFQFVDVAAVVGGAGGVEAVRESARLTREDPLGVLGYTLARVAVGGAVLLPAVVVGYVVGPVPGLGSVGWVLAGLLAPVAFAAVTSVHVAYYRRRRPGAWTTPSRDEGVPE